MTDRAFDPSQAPDIPATASDLIVLGGARARPSPLRPIALLAMGAILGAYLSALASGPSDLPYVALPHLAPGEVHSEFRVFYHDGTSIHVEVNELPVSLRYDIESGRIVEVAKDLQNE